jgi:rRNA-processing protein cgr1
MARKIEIARLRSREKELALTMKKVCAHDEKGLHSRAQAK